jgi:hypothetical protein
MMGWLLLVRLISLIETMGMEGTAFKSLLLLYNPMFPQVTCFACCLLHASFWLSLFSTLRMDKYSSETSAEFQRATGVISQRLLMFSPMFISSFTCYHLSRGQTPFPTNNAYKYSHTKLALTFHIPTQIVINIRQA